MKYLFFLIAIVGITHSSCNKKSLTNQAPVSLAGKWRMILVTENSLGTRITKSSSIQKDVDIIFNAASSTNGTLSGSTPTNSIFESTYLTRADQTLTIPGLNMTKVRETSWGYEFVNNILDSREYKIEADGSLNIKTTGKILTFEKL